MRKGLLILAQVLVTIKGIDRVADPDNPTGVYWVLKTVSSLPAYTAELTFTPLEGNTVKQQVTVLGVGTKYTVVFGPTVPIKAVEANVAVTEKSVVIIREVR